VLNIVTGPGGEIGKALAASPRIAKVAFTGETVTGRLIMQYAAHFYQPTVLTGHNKMRVFQEEIFGPVLAVTTFRDEAEAIARACGVLKSRKSRLTGFGKASSRLLSASAWRRASRQLWPGPRR